MPINPQDRRLKTALFLAATSDNTASAPFATLMHYLIEKEDQINVKDNTGKTPLHHAASRPSIALVKLLIEHGELINTENQYVNTALTIAQNIPST